MGALASQGPVRALPVLGRVGGPVGSCPAPVQGEVRLLDRVWFECRWCLAAVAGRVGSCPGRGVLASRGPVRAPLVFGCGGGLVGSCPAPVQGEVCVHSPAMIRAGACRHPAAVGCCSFGHPREPVSWSGERRQGVSSAVVGDHHVCFRRSAVEFHRCGGVRARVLDRVGQCLLDDPVDFPDSRSISAADNANVPPHESPSITIRLAGTPFERRYSKACTVSSTGAGNGCSGAVR